VYVGRVLLGILALGSAPQVNATVCGETTSLVRHARSYFHQIRGNYDSDMEEYASTIVLPGADECTIEEDQYTATYRCQWLFAANDENGARQATQSLMTEIRGCWPRATTRDFQYARLRSQSRKFHVEDDVTVQVGRRYHERPRRPQYNRWVVYLEVEAEKP